MEGRRGGEGEQCAHLATPLRMARREGGGPVACPPKRATSALGRAPLSAASAAARSAGARNASPPSPTSPYEPRLVNRKARNTPIGIPQPRMGQGGGGRGELGRKWMEGEEEEGGRMGGGGWKG